MGLTIEQKQAIREKVAQGTPPKQVSGNGYAPAPAPAPALIPVSIPVDELLIEITGSNGSASVTLRPSEVSRLRGRYGRSPGFEQWVVARVRDAMVSFGGG